MKARCRSLLATALLRVLLFVGLGSMAVAALGAEPGPPVTLEGTVLVLVVDEFEHGRSHLRYFLRERRSNERLELKLSPHQAELIRPGQELRVRGRRGGSARVAVGGSCTVKVIFKPTSTGAKSAILRITPGGGAALKSVSLSGRGI